MVKTSIHNNLSLRSVLEKDKLNGSNFCNWYWNLRKVLKQERKDYVLERALPEKSISKATHAEYDAWYKHYTDVVDVRNLMLTTMNSELKKQYENMESPMEIIAALEAKGLARVERCQIVRHLVECKLPEGNPVSPHVSKMIGYVDNLERLGCPVSTEWATDLILQSLPSSYDEFVKDYHDKGLTMTLTDLHEMLETAELDIKKGSQNVLRVHRDKCFKKPNKDKGRNKAILITDQDGPMSSCKPKSDSQNVLRVQRDEGLEKTSKDAGGNKTIQISDQDGPVSSSKPNSGPSEKCSYCKEQGHLGTNCNKFKEDLLRVMMEYESPSSGICVTSFISTQRYSIPNVMLISVLACRALTIVEE